MASESLIIRMRTQGAAEVSAEMTRAEASVGRYESRAGAASRASGGLAAAFRHLRGMAIAAAGTVGILGLVGGIGDAIKSAQAFQVVTGQLGAAVHANLRKPVAGATDALVRYAESLATSGGFAPTAALQGLAMLVRATHNQTRAQRDLSLATNIARGSHRDLSQTVRAVAMVEGGRLAGLARMGIVLPKHITATQALTILTQRFAGATSAYNRTATGAYSNLRNSIDILTQRLGAHLLPILTTVFNWLGRFITQIEQGRGAGGEFRKVVEQIAGVLKTLAGYLIDAGRWVVHTYEAFQQGRAWAIALVAAIAALISGFIAFRAIMFVIGVIRAIQAAWVILNLVFAASPIGILLLALAALGGALFILYMKVGAVRSIMDAVWSWLKGAVVNTVNFVRDHWKLIAFAIVAPFVGIPLLLATQVTAIKSIVIDVINWLIGKVNWFIRAFNNTLGALGGVLGIDVKIGEIGLVNTAAQDAAQAALNQAAATYHQPSAPAGRSSPGHQVGSAAPPPVSHSHPGQRGFAGDTPTTAAPARPRGFAAGGWNDWPGVYDVGEHGRERVFLPAGAYVDPHPAPQVLEATLVNQMDGREVGRSLVRVGLAEAALR